MADCAIGSFQIQGDDADSGAIALLAPSACDLQRRVNMNKQADELKKRTKKFALDVLEFLDTFPTVGSPTQIALQLTHSATSVAANYRAACRSRSKAEFAAKIGVVLEESDESSLWLEIADERGLGPAQS